MATVQTIWGIDVGRCALKALRLRLTADGAVEIVGQHYIEHAKILTQPDANRHELIAGALEKFLAQNDLSKDQVVVGVPGQHTLARFTKLPPVAPKRIPDIVRYEADQQIPFDMDDVIWDFQTFAAEGSPDLEVGIFAMKRELLREHLLHFEQAGIEPIAVQPSPLAIYNAARFDGMLSDETTVLLDVGAANSELVIATSFSLWTRTIPIGGNTFTDALVKAFKLSFAKAEALKRTAQTSKYRRQIFQAMRPTFADLVQELQRSMGFYSSTHRDAQIEKVVGSGNSFRLPDFQKYLQQNLGIDVERVNSFKKVAPSPVLSDEFFKDNVHCFMVAYGLALQGLDQGKITSNLLPTEIAKQAVWRKKKPAFAAAAACLVLAGGLIWFRYATDMRALAASSQGSSQISITADTAPRVLDEGPSPSLTDRAKAVTVQEAAKAMRERLSSMADQGKREREETEDLVALQRNKSVVPRILKLVHASLPASDDPLVASETVEDYFERLASAPARGKRSQVFIDSLTIHYEDNLNSVYWTPVGQVEEPINSPDSKVSGFKIEMECTTPNEKGPRFIQEAFMDQLKKNGRRPGAGFYVDRVYLIEGIKLEAYGIDAGAKGRATIGRSPGGAAGVRGAFPGATPQPTSVVTKEVDPNTLDHLTNESIKDDWRFTIWADVILDELPESHRDAAADQEDDDE